MTITSPTTPAALLLQELVKHHLTVATAESCTGGNIAHLITEVAGASEAMLGGVVSYSNEVKARLLGVSTDDLERHGAVSRPVVEQMAAGACRATGARCAMATSGIAGPGGGSALKPVGTVLMAWAIDGRVCSELCHFSGSRSEIISRASLHAINSLIKLITNHTTYHE